LTDLLETKTGRSEVEQLSDNETKNADGTVSHHHTTLTSLTNDDGSPDYTNSSTGPEDHDAFRARQPTDVTVHINPNHPVSAPSDPSLGDRGSARSDDALSHEFAHSLDVTHGTYRPLAVPPEERPAGDRNDKLGPLAPLRQEYDAIGLLNPPHPLDTENHYLAERKALGEGGANLEPDDAAQQLRTSATYLPMKKEPAR
jgi:hypothetical protein